MKRSLVDLGSDLENGAHDAWVFLQALADLICGKRRQVTQVADRAANDDGGLPLEADEILECHSRRRLFLFFIYRNMVVLASG